MRKRKPSIRKTRDELIRGRFYRVPVFKALLPGGKPTYALNDFVWSRPKNGKPGKWMQDSPEPLAICNHGLHLTTQPWGFYSTPQVSIYLAEYEIPEVNIPSLGSTGKFCVYRARLLRKVTRAEANKLGRRRLRLLEAE